MLPKANLDAAHFNYKIDEAKYDLVIVVVTVFK